MAESLRAALPAQFTGDRCTLRLMSADDWAVEVALSAEPDVVRWTRYPPDLDEAGARARAEKQMQRAADRAGGRFIVHDPAGGVAGTAGIAMNGQRTPEVFYALLTAGRGRGLATSATCLLTVWALRVGHDVVALKTITGNTASEGVARRSGFRPVAFETATIRDAEVELRRWERAAPDRGRCDAPTDPARSTEGP